MDLYGPVKFASRIGKKYILVIVNDYARFTWTFFLRFKEETFLVFEAFVKQVQVKYNEKITEIRSNHGTKFENAKLSQSIIILELITISELL